MKDCHKSRELPQKLGPPKRRVLLSAALALPGIVPAHADDAAMAPEIRIKYFQYHDSQSGGEDRIDVSTPLVWLRTPISDHDVIEASAQYDHISGASPYYLDTVSGATGKGIRDNRETGDLRLTHSFERWSLALGGSLSNEDDYLSRSASLEGHWWTADKNTTVTAGFSPSFDRITSTNNIMLLDRRRTFGYLVGVTQVINPISVIQSNLSYQNERGYLTDQYKYLDNRPRSRDEFAWLTRYNLYIKPADASLHLDYRYFVDSWGIDSHTFEVQWYQPIGETWMLRPDIRYYSQSAADFFSDEFPPIDDSFYSADQRVAAFGGLSWGLKLVKQFPDGYSVDLLFQMFQQHASWKLDGGGTHEIDPLHAYFFGVGFGKVF